MNLGIQIYTNDETVEHLQIITGELMKGVPEKRPFRVGSFTVIPFYLPHTTRDKDTGQLIPCFNYGYIVEHEEMGKLLYMTDFEYCKYNFSKLNIEHIMVEANYDMELVDRDEPNYEHRLRGHMRLDTALKFIEANDNPALRNVILIHLSDKCGDPAKFSQKAKETVKYGADVYVAEKGLEVDMNLCPF